MKISTEPFEGRSRVKIEGELLIASAVEAKGELIAALVAGGGSVELDLSGVEDCDTAGVQLLLMARASAQAQGGRLTIGARSPSVLTAIDRIGIPLNCFEA